MDAQELVSTLKKQHLLLGEDLTTALEISEQKNENYGQAVLAALTKFKTDLSEHLKLEDEEFYTDYFKRTAGNERTVSSAQELKVEMNQIAEVVIEFLDKYSSCQSVESNPEDFQAELLSIIATLKLRIEVEEEGIYGIYLLEANS